MYQELEDIITELSSHNPDIDWDVMISRINTACDLIGPTIERSKYIRGALLAFVSIHGLESQEGFLLGIARTELLKLSWV